MSFKILKDKLKSTSFGESLHEKLSSFIKHDSPEPGDEGHERRSLKTAISDSIHEKLSSLVRQEQVDANGGDSLEKKEAKEDASAAVLSSSPPRALDKEESFDERVASPQKSEDIEKEIYEQQLTQLQEQLVAAMIENENLVSQLSNDKEDSELKKLRKDLEYERARNAQLAKRVEDLDKSATPQANGSGTAELKPTVATARLAADGTRASLSALCKEDDAEDAEDAADVSGSLRLGWLARLKDYGRQKLWELLEDLGDTDEPPAPPETALAVKRLKTNVVRFSDAVAPIFESISGMKVLFSWQYPMLTTVLFLLYMLIVWKGFLLQTILLIVVLRLVLNYATEKKIVSEISFLPTEAEKEKKAVEKELGVGEKFSIVLHVAAKVQNKLGDISDGIEKINNLLMWRQPELTKQIFLPLCGALVATVILSTDTLLFVAGVGIGIKLFVLDSVYGRYPRIRAKYDSSYILWNSLLTNSDLEKHRARKEIQQDCIPGQSSFRRSSTAGLPDDSPSAEDAAFCDRFDLPYTEAPLRQSAFKDGKHCVIFEKDSSLSISAVLSNHAKLFLTQSFLCYERAGGERKMIALAKVTHVEKKKTFGFIPGGGMSLEIAVEGFDKPYVVAGLLNRDECYACLMDIGSEHGLSFAVQQHWTALRELRSGEVRLSTIDTSEYCDISPISENAFSGPHDAF